MVVIGVAAVFLAAMTLDVLATAWRETKAREHGHAGHAFARAR